MKISDRYQKPTINFSQFNFFEVQINFFKDRIRSHSVVPERRLKLKENCLQSF